ncbi:MAG: hypothetical protein M1376_03225 [Planctomycetes bacterium]|nr:hypothetical protein [Planctomycetota bacterium]
MNSHKRATVNVLATGVVVVLLMSLGLFWARWLCSAMRFNLLPPCAREVAIYPGHQFGFDGGVDPNLVAAPRVRARMSTHEQLLAGLGLGASHYLEMQLPGTQIGPQRDAYVYRWESGAGGQRIYFDPALGLIVRTGIERVPEGREVHAARHVVYYAGPEGVSPVPEEKLGRFIAPVADSLVVVPQTVYDPALRRFFAIDWRENKLVVKKGPELPQDVLRHPVQIGVIQKGSTYIDIPAPDKVVDGTRSPKSVFWSYNTRADRVLVLDASGRLDWLDPQTLEIRGPAGYLPMPATLFGSGRSRARPEDVAGYEACAISSYYGKGMAVATLSREGLALELDYFDTIGVQVVGGGTAVPGYGEPAPGKTGTARIPSAKAAYFYLPGAQVLTLAQFTLENLHPPVFLLASYLAGPHLDATAGYRSLFLLPDSFVAMSARDARAGLVGRVARAVFLALPAFLLLLVLAWRVTRDGMRLGLPKNTRAAWAIGTVLFGLPAYITYRLTRPKVTLVTCANCGAGRRPDREKCQRCGSPWVVPELVPPAWRVLGEQEPAEESSSAPVRQADSSAH